MSQPNRNPICPACGHGKWSWNFFRLIRTCLKCGYEERIPIRFDSEVPA